MKYFFRLLFVLSVFMLPACSSTLKVKDGSTAYQLEKYTLASDMLQKDFEQSKDVKQKSRIALQIAKSYDYQQKYDESLKWYKIIYDLGSDENRVDLYLNALKQNEQYAEAFDFLSNYVKANKSEKYHWQKELDFLSAALKEIQKKIPHVVVNLKDINSSSSDFAGFFKNNEIWFSSTRTPNKESGTDEWSGEGYSDIMKAEKKSKTSFGQVVDAPEFNTPYHDAEVVFTRDGQEAYFTRSGTNDVSKNDHSKIYYTKQTDGKWSEPKQLSFFADTINEGQPYLSPSGNELFFSSDAPDGYGGRDIYIVKKNSKGVFENPVNAGSKINTAGDELFPVLADSTHLFFSSNGRMGYGGLDIFSATKEGKIFTNVQNVGMPINSGGDDLYFQQTQTGDDSVILSGYLTSNRKGGLGNDDLYYIEQRKAPREPLPPAVYILRVSIVENVFAIENNPNSAVTGTKPVGNAKIQIPKFDVVSTLSDVVTTDDNGKFTKNIPNQGFLGTVTKEGYLANSFSVSKIMDAKDGDTIYVDRTVVLQKIFKNVEIVLNNIYYDYDKWNIRSDASQSLDTLTDILKKNPTIKIELASHTDCRGTDTYNQTLSQKRAESVVQYLIAKGIEADRLTAKGYGESIPVEKCDCKTCTEEQHQRNRRTTFKILSE